MQKIKIMVATHKPNDVYHNDFYMPIHIGKRISSYNLSWQGDDTGDNISEKNPNYCELTALYWAWKNLKNIDFIGLCHYRRYFGKKNLGYSLRDVINCKIPESENLLNKTDIVVTLEKADIILPCVKSLPMSVKNDYVWKHIPEDFEVLEQTVKSLYPNYRQSFDYVMNHTHKLSCYNMFIARQEFLQDYCQWLFDILFEVERNIKISEYPYQARVFGFMAERLLNVYCFHHSLRIAYHPVIYITEESSYSQAAYALRNMKYSLAYALSRMDYRKK